MSEQNNKPPQKNIKDFKAYLHEPLTPFIICIFVSIILNALLPIALFPEFLSIWGTVCLVIVALLLGRWSVKQIEKNGETWVPHLIETQTLTIGGPYYFSRNPIIISAIVLYLALFLAMNNLWGFIMIIPLVFLLTKYVIIFRENKLREEYGEIYEDYFQKTSRWF